MPDLPDVSKDMRALVDLIGKRSEKLYAWLRWLVLLAAGFFSLMAGQLAGKAFAPAPLALLKLALVLTAAGILFGAVALFGEVSSHRHAVLAYKERIANRVRGIAAASSAPVGGKPSWLSTQAEWPCYACLAAALLVWCAFVISL